MANHVEAYLYTLSNSWQQKYQPMLQLAEPHALHDPTEANSQQKQRFADASAEHAHLLQTFPIHAC